MTNEFVLATIALLELVIIIGLCVALYAARASAVYQELRRCRESERFHRDAFTDAARRLTAFRNAVDRVKDR
jgi:hypothetical protein